MEPQDRLALGRAVQVRRQALPVHLHVGLLDVGDGALPFERVEQRLHPDGHVEVAADGEPSCAKRDGRREGASVDGEPRSGVRGDRERRSERRAFADVTGPLDHGHREHGLADGELPLGGDSICSLAAEAFRKRADSLADGAYGAHLFEPAGHCR